MLTENTFPPNVEYIVEEFKGDFGEHQTTNLRRDFIPWDRATNSPAKNFTSLTQFNEIQQPTLSPPPNCAAHPPPLPSATYPAPVPYPPLMFPRQPLPQQEMPPPFLNRTANFFERAQKFEDAKRKMASGPQWGQEIRFLEEEHGLALSELLITKRTLHDSHIEIDFLRTVIIQKNRKRK